MRATATISTCHGGALVLHRPSPPVSSQLRPPPRLFRRMYDCENNWVRMRAKIEVGKECRLSARANAKATSEWNSEPYGDSRAGGNYNLDEHDVATFLDPPMELIPLDPSSSSSYARKKIEKIPNSTEEQERAISQLPSKMTNRCKALMRRVICFSVENGSVDTMLAAWVKSTKPERADWLSVLKEIERSNHPLYFEVFEHALTQESFEPNIRDYTKIIHAYAKQNMLQQAERALSSMKNRGFVSDQVTLTALVHMYSKAGNLKLAKDSFEEMKSLGVPLDKRSYGSMIMAYIRAGKLDHGEQLLKDMEDRDIYAGREVYKALLRAYSMTGDYQGAQWVFDAIQMAGIVPDARICGLLINAYLRSGQNREACVAFENMRKCGLKPNDKCVALVIAAYERENKLKEALSLLVELEKDGLMFGKESLEAVLNWSQKLGVVDEVEVVLRDFGSRMPQPAV